METSPTPEMRKRQKIGSEDPSPFDNIQAGIVDLFHFFFFEVMKKKSCWSLCCLIVKCPSSSWKKMPSSFLQCQNALLLGRRRAFWRMIFMRGDECSQTAWELHADITKFPHPHCSIRPHWCADPRLSASSPAGLLLYSKLRWRYILVISGWLADSQSLEYQ